MSLQYYSLSRFAWLIFVFFIFISRIFISLHYFLSVLLYMICMIYLYYNLLYYAILYYTTHYTLYSITIASLPYIVHMAFSTINFPIFSYQFHIISPHINCSTTTDPIDDVNHKYNSRHIGKEEKTLFDRLSSFLSLSLSIRIANGRLTSV